MPFPIPPPAHRHGSLALPFPFLPAPSLASLSRSPRARGSGGPLTRLAMLHALHAPTHAQRPIVFCAWHALPSLLTACHCVERSLIASTRGRVCFTVRPFMAPSNLRLACIAAWAIPISSATPRTCLGASRLSMLVLFVPSSPPHHRHHLPLAFVLPLHRPHLALCFLAFPRRLGPLSSPSTVDRSEWMNERIGATMCRAAQIGCFILCGPSQCALCGQRVCVCATRSKISPAPCGCCVQVAVPPPLPLLILPTSYKHIPTYFSRVRSCIPAGKAWSKIVGVLRACASG